eukprot:4286990-Ditylum_brightwellii.AAC.1
MTRIREETTSPHTVEVKKNKCREKKQKLDKLKEIKVFICDAFAEMKKMMALRCQWLCTSIFVDAMNRNDDNDVGAFNCWRIIRSPGDTRKNFYSEIAP